MSKGRGQLFTVRNEKFKGDQRGSFSTKEMVNIWNELPVVPGEADTIKHVKGIWTGTWIGKALRDMSLMWANGIRIDRHHGWHGQGLQRRPVS